MSNTLTLENSQMTPLFYQTTEALSKIYFMKLNFSHLPHMLVHLSLFNALVLCSPVRQMK